MSTIFELQPQISFMSVWTPHYKPLPGEAIQTIIAILIFCYFYAILIPIVSITIGITVRIAITIGIRISVGITIRIITTGGRITTGIVCIRMKTGITIRITRGFTITINITIQITLRRTMTSKPTALGKWGRQTNGQTHKMFFAHNTV
jgi:hypothetical protein